MGNSSVKYVANIIDIESFLRNYDGGHLQRPTKIIDVMQDKLSSEQLRFYKFKGDTLVDVIANFFYDFKVNISFQ